MNDLLLATSNKHKVKEITAMLEGTGWEIYDLSDLPSIKLPPEEGETFQENALQKAMFGAEQSHMLVLADDSGLVVEALNGAPGVLSARYAGEGHDDAANTAKLLDVLKGEENRKAAFVCAMALAFPEEERFFVIEEWCEGLIAQEPIGENGFGYDPVFYVPELGKTMAQLSDDEKNNISHRGKALARMNKMLTDVLEICQDKMLTPEIVQELKEKHQREQDNA